MNHKKSTVQSNWINLISLTTALAYLKIIEQSIWPQFNCINHSLSEILCMSLLGSIIIISFIALLEQFALGFIKSIKTKLIIEWIVIFIFLSLLTPDLISNLDTIGFIMGTLLITQGMRIIYIKNAQKFSRS